MGRKSKSKSAERIKCPWCGRIVGWSRKDNLAPHINQAGNPCVGVGQPKHQIEAHLELINKTRS